MKYPTPGEYQEALQFPETSFSDPDLKAGKPEVSALGLPKAITGSFAAVFPVDTACGKVAVRCFLSEAGRQRQRYHALARHLEAHPLPYFTEFTYQRNGILISDRWWPLVKMAWVDGLTINQFVGLHLDDSTALKELSSACASAFLALEQAGISHGDLQHGNILVSGHGKELSVRLVDYDTVFIPSAGGRTSFEIGHRNYQHPDRTVDDIGPHLDRFSALVIHTALEALSYDPSLWVRYDTGENLLFSREDFYDPASSPLFRDLRSVDRIRPLVDQLIRCCYAQIDQIPPLSAILDGKPLASGSIRPRRRKHAYRLSRVERLVLPVVFLSIVCLVASVISGQYLIASATVLLAVGGTALLVAVTVASRPEIRRRRRLERELVYLESIVQSLLRKKAQKESERRKLVENRSHVWQKRLSELREKALYDHLKYHFVSELAEIDGLNHRAVVHLKSKAIRTAFNATPDRVAQLNLLSDQTRALINMWRGALVRQYERELPTKLTSGEKRRLENMIRQRVEALNAEVRRIDEKIELQLGEHRRIAGHISTVETVGAWRYLKHLFRIEPLPTSLRTGRQQS